MCKYRCFTIPNINISILAIHLCYRGNGAFKSRMNFRLSGKSILALCSDSPTAQAGGG